MDDRNAFIERNTGLVHACCHRFSGRGIEYDDLYQAGCIGLIKAADNFDEQRGLCFSTYAVPVILGEIKRLFRDGGAVKVSRSLKDLSLKAARVRETVSAELGREPSVSELAQRLGVDTEQLTEALCAAQPTLSLTFESEDGTGELDLPDDDIQGELCDRIALEEAMSSLDERDRALLRLRYYGGRTQCQTAERLGMTQVQVSRREKALLSEMRKLLTK